MAAILGALGMAVGAIGIFLGFFYLDSRPGLSIRIVCFTTVGLAGLLAFIRHVVFHRSDAKRMGWETDRPDWMFEVGFANLAFGLVAMAAAAGLQPPSTLGFLLVGYALYLFQAALLHGFRYATSPVKSPAQLWRSCVATLLYVSMMVFFALRAFALR